AGEHTQLNGAVISSTASADKNRLDTGTLGFSNIENHADYKTEHQSVGMSTGGSIGSQFEGNMANGLLAGLNGSGSASSVTESAVSDGTIVIRDKAKQTQDVSALSRDAEGANPGLDKIFDKDKEQRRMETAQLLAEIGSQAGDIARTQGGIAATKAATEKMKNISPDQRKDAEAQWRKANPGHEPTTADITGQVYQTLYNRAMLDSGMGTGGAVQQGISAATAAIQGLAGGNIAQAVSGAAAPYLAEQIHALTTTKGPNGREVVNVEANLVAHAVVGAVTAYASGNAALAGASGAAMGEYIAQQMYPGVKREDLSEEQRQTISALGTLAAGLAGGNDGGSAGNAVAGAQAGKNAVENNWLSVQEADRKKQLETKRDYLKQELTSAETKELADINQSDKARNKAIKSVCTDGNKGGAACGALIGPAQDALKKYGENATYSLLYKDLYPQDVKNLEGVLQGLDAGSISRDQAITAIAQASGVSWETAAGRYDTAMQTQELTAALAGAYGLKSVIKEPTKESSAKQQSQPSTGRTAEPNRIAADEEASGWSQYNKYRNESGDWNWPAKLGFAEEPVKTTLPVGTRLDRYGEPSGSFLAPKGTPYEQRALAPGAGAEKYYEYEVIKPLPVIQGKIAPAFGEAGGGIQILPNMQERVNVEWLLKNEYIREVH
ncbi:glycohydrolase toxin TNT-related protein, partial [Pantoea vagans]|uniref:glycohydrolase toxin TNT-related protein n=1 Tax=Pantoea vagans TaxID=470934 RepID=UPI00225384B3